MSAPHEVWIHSPIRGQAAYAEVRNGRDLFILSGPIDARYLRADLTCGDCAYKSINTRKACAHAINAQTVCGRIVPEFWLTPDDNAPSCMAIKVKAGAIKSIGGVE